MGFTVMISPQRHKDTTIGTTNSQRRKRRETEKENNEQRTMVVEFENIELRRIRNRKFSVFRLLNYSPHHSSLIPDSRFQIPDSKF